MFQNNPRSAHKPRRSNSDHQPVARLIRGRFDIGDVAGSRVGPAETRNRRVEITTVQQMDAALILVVGRQVETT